MTLNNPDKMIQKILYAIMIAGSGFLLVITKILYELRTRSKKWASKIRRLSDLRIEKTRKDFIKYFIKKGYSRKIVKFVYLKVQDYIKAKDLTLLPDDDFRIIYEIDEDDWIYPLKDWFEEIRKPFPSDSFFNYLNEKHQKINFEYLIELFDHKEKHLEAKLENSYL
jgi:hypothetical protein